MGSKLSCLAAVDFHETVTTEPPGSRVESILLTLTGFVKATDNTIIGLRFDLNLRKDSTGIEANQQ